MDQGWVYILVNPTIPGLVKVGRTTRLPADRMAELSGATGVATPFVLVFEQLFLDCVAAERAVHAILDSRGMRVTASREFFRATPGDVIRIVLDYASGCEPQPCPAKVPSGRDLVALGDQYLFGEGNMLQDLGEAMTCYRMAASQGSPVALERLGAIMAHARKAYRGNKTRAMGYLREGLRRGNYFCYCEIAAMAAEEGHVVNFIKAWDLFFAHRTTSYLSEVEFGANRYTTALQRYVVTCFTLGLVPAHQTELSESADELVAMLTTALERVGASPDARQSLIVALRWVRLRLMRVPVPTTMARHRWSWLSRLALVRRRYAEA